MTGVLFLADFQPNRIVSPKFPKCEYKMVNAGQKKRSNITSSSLANLEGEEPVTAAKTAALKCRADAKL